MRKLFPAVGVVVVLLVLAPISCAHEVASTEGARSEPTAPTAPTTVVQIPAPTASPTPERGAVEPDSNGDPRAVSDDVGDRGGRRGDSCGPPPPPLRQGGDLVVTSPATPREQPSYLRLRTHVSGALTSGSRRRWDGIEVPTFVPLVTGAPGGRATAELSLLDRTSDDGYLAFYRDPYGAGTSCTLGARTNCAFVAAAYGCDGSQAWQVNLNAVLSRKEHLEIQDIRYDGGVLYFNEACQTYAKDAGGKCSSLVAIDPKSARVLWRTPALVSNNRFTVLPNYIVAGYGFTAEPDFVRLVRRSDGVVVDKKALPSAPSFFEVEGDDVTAHVYSDKLVHFHLVGQDGPSAKLVVRR